MIREYKTYCDEFNAQPLNKNTKPMHYNLWCRAQLAAANLDEYLKQSENWNFQNEAYWQNDSDNKDYIHSFNVFNVSGMFRELNRLNIDFIARQQFDNGYTYESDYMVYMADRWYNAEDEIFSSEHFDIDIDQLLRDYDHDTNAWMDQGHLEVYSVTHEDWYEQNAATMSKVKSNYDETIKELKAKLYDKSQEVIKTSLEWDKLVEEHRDLEAVSMELRDHLTELRVQESYLKGKLDAYTQISK